MAVIDAYVDSLVDAFGAAPVMTDAIKMGGSGIKVRVAEVVVNAGDDDGSKYRLFKVGANEVPILCAVSNTAITGGTSYDLGLYRMGTGGAVKIKDVFMTATTMASARASLWPATAANGLANLVSSTAGISNRRMFEHAGDTMRTKQIEYDFTLTANTIGTVLGAVTVLLITAINQ